MCLNPWAFLFLFDTRLYSHMNSKQSSLLLWIYNNHLCHPNAITSGFSLVSLFLGWQLGLWYQLLYDQIPKSDLPKWSPHHVNEIEKTINIRKAQRIEWVSRPSLSYIHGTTRQIFIMRNKCYKRRSKYLYTSYIFHNNENYLLYNVQETYI